MSTTAERITFHDDLGVVEIDLTDLTLKDPVAVAAFFKAASAELKRRGGRWRLLSNQAGFQIEPCAWGAYAHCAKSFRDAHVVSAARYNAAAEDADAETFPDRAAALACLARQRAAEKPPAPAGAPARLSVEIGVERVAFDAAAGIAEVDLSDVRFDGWRDVDRFFDGLDYALERAGEPAGGRWWLLVDYAGCRIAPEAWTAFARRARKTAERFAHGSVRYGLGDAGADPNTQPTRADALARLETLRASPPAPPRPRQGV